MAAKNPFITKGYAGSEYFCDREKETKTLVKWLTNNNNVALISPRRYGKTDLIRHCFTQPEIDGEYYTFVIDIYSAKSLNDIVMMLSDAIIKVLMSKSKKALESFLNILQSLRGCFSYDWSGTPSFTVGIGDIHTPEKTLSEIFEYLEKADKPCIVAIDEFQQVAKIGENIEALLRTHVQYCENATFIFSGSERHMMGEIFTSPKRPFYQSTTLYFLDRLPLDKYSEFCKRLFENGSKQLESDVVPVIYERFDGVTYYMQRIMNEMYSDTPKEGTCSIADIDIAVQSILDASSVVYENLMYQLPEKQRIVMKAIARSGIAEQPTSIDFIQKHKLTSPNSVKAALPALIDKDLVTTDKGKYMLCDKFLELWICEEECW